MKLRRLLTLALAAAFLFVAPMTAKADTTEETGWKQNDKGWWYEYVDENGETAFYNDGPQYIAEDEAWYFFDELGYMQTGWIYAAVENTYEDYQGNEIKDNQYYWYYANSKGELARGWQMIDGNWYYFADPEANGWWYGMPCSMYEDGTYGILEGEGEDAEEVLYHFAPSGEMTTGWYYHTNETYGYGQWYYSAQNGVVYTGWQNLGGAWYYFSEYSGYMYADTSWSDYDEETDSYDTYWFRADGTMVTGWYNRAGSNSIYGDWVYCNADGTAVDGWMWGGDAWYYLEDGMMAQDQYIYTYKEVEEDGYAYQTVDKKYYVGRDGKMITGWYDDSYKSANYSYTSWMYANADGTIEEQWVKSGNDWYFINSYGEMVADGRYYCVVEGEKTPERKDYDSYDSYYAALVNWQRAHYYIFDASGKMVTNTWYTSEDSWGTDWYYADANGNGYTGWVQTNGLWYYCSYGVMQRDTYVPGGYYVNADGVWVQ